MTLFEKGQLIEYWYTSIQQVGFIFVKKNFENCLDTWQGSGERGCAPDSHEANDTRFNIVQLLLSNKC